MSNYYKAYGETHMANLWFLCILFKGQGDRAVCHITSPGVRQWPVRSCHLIGVTPLVSLVEPLCDAYRRTQLPSNAFI